MRYDELQKWPQAHQAPRGLPALPPGGGGLGGGEALGAEDVRTRHSSSRYMILYI